MIRKKESESLLRLNLWLFSNFSISYTINHNTVRLIFMEMEDCKCICETGMRKDYPNV